MQFDPETQTVDIEGGRVQVVPIEELQIQKLERLVVTKKGTLKEVSYKKQLTAAKAKMVAREVVKEAVEEA